MLSVPSQRIYKYKVEGQIHELWRLGWSGGLMSTNKMCGFGYKLMVGMLAEGARCTARVTQHRIGSGLGSRIKLFFPKFLAPLRNI
jgi:hypothetical protein